MTVAVSLFLMAAIGAQAQSDPVTAHVRSVTGIALIKANHQSAAAALKRNATIEPNNIIETGPNSRVIISLTDGGQITVLPNSTVVLKNFIVPHTARELLEIITGRVLVKIRHVGGKPNHYRLNSPTASIAVRGTEFIVDVLLGGETVVVVREGLVEVWSHDKPDNKRLVTPGGRVIVRPGGDISSAFPGPGSGLNGRARFNGGLGEDYQRSVDNMAQNSNEISPAFFSAFPDQHLDSLENPAYAADFKSAEGRMFLLPSASEPYWDFTKLKNKPQFDISVSPQMTFFTPIPGSRLVVGGGVSAFGVRSENRYDRWFTDDMFHYRQALRMNAFNVSFIAAYNLGDDGKTSVGIGIDKLSGYGNFLSEFVDNTDSNYTMSFDNMNALFARTRLTFGLTRQFSNGKKLGLYYRHGINSSDQESLHTRKYEYKDGSYPGAKYFTHVKTNISTISSEVGARFRAPLTRRLFFGGEGSYLYERVKSGSVTLNTHDSDRYRYLARRSRLGMGLGFALTSKTLLNLDVTGGVFNNDRPPQEPINTFSYYSSLGSLRSVGGTFVSAHSAAQTNLWRGLFLSVSNITSVRREAFYLPSLAPCGRFSLIGGIPDGCGNTYTFNTHKFKDTSYLSNFGLGWKFKPNFITEYVYSVDHRNRESSHSFKIRYTFNLSITGEK